MIPIFRAKKIDSDEYVSGNLVEFDDEYFIVKDTEGCYLASDCFHYLHYNEIDPTTLSIHFPDMLDSQGNKIFASLQEDGKGGDVILFCEVENITGTAIYEKSSIFITGGCSEYLSEILQREDEDFKIIGIQQ